MPATYKSIQRRIQRLEDDLADAEWIRDMRERSDAIERAKVQAMERRRRKTMKISATLHSATITFFVPCPVNCQYDL